MAHRERVQMRKRAGGHWYVRFTDNEGERHERCLKREGGTAITNKIHAGGMAKELADLLDEGQPWEWFFGGTRPGERTFGSLVDEFLERGSRWSPSTRFGNAGTVNQLRQEFGERPLPKISSRDIEEYLARRRLDGLSESSVNRYIATIRVILEEGVKWGYLRRSPGAELKQKGEGRKLPRPYHEDEVTRLLAALDPETRDVAQLYVHTALRRGELMKLIWADVDLVGATITVRAPKNNRDRVVPLSPEALRILSDRRPKWEREQSDVHDDPRVYGPRADIHKTVRASWHVLAPERHDTLRPVHSFRDTSITRMARAGIPLHHVQEFAGHASVEMTRRYAEVSAQDLRDSVARAFDT
jgi:integrase/recombinase XerD